MKNQFINVSLGINTMDRYLVRSSIFNALNKQLADFSGRLLDAGCGQMPYKQHIFENSAITDYTGLDIEQAITYSDSVSPDVTWDGHKMPFDDESFDVVMSTEVLEHCPDPMVYLDEVYRVLTPGGKLFFTVPFLWPLHEVPHDAYRYTPFTLQRMFKETGFSKIEVKALGGFNASLATMLGLWLQRHLRKSYKKTILKWLFFPFIKWLIKRDSPPKTFKESTMCTGFYGLIIK